MAEVRETVAEVGLPVVVRPSFTMGGLAPGWHTRSRMSSGWPGRACRLAQCQRSHRGVHLRMEGIRTRADARRQRQRRGGLLDRERRPDGVHTGDSVTVAPAMTLTDREYQKMRDLGIAILREVGVDTGAATSSSRWTQKTVGSS